MMRGFEPDPVADYYIYIAFQNNGCSGFLLRINDPYFPQY